MKAFDRVVAKKAKRQPLAGVHVLGVQHLLGTTGSLARAMARSGSKPGEVTLLGKSYSDAPEVIEELRADGFRAVPGEKEFTTGFAAVGQITLAGRPGEHMQRVVRSALSRLPDDGSPLVVLDDGGKLIQHLHEHHPEILHRVVAVEQTRKGVRVLEKMKLKVPVVDVAQSWAKLKLEAPSIGRSVGQAIESKVDKLRAAGAEVGRRAVLIGGGVVGLASASYLKRAGFEVEVYDASPEARAAAAAQGFRVHERLEDALPRAEILVSATGTNAVRAKDLDLLPDGAVLINAASGNTEITAHPSQYVEAAGHSRDGKLWTSFRGRRLPIGDADHPASHDKVLRTHSGKELLLARDGNVINFDFRDSNDPIPPRYIQLTRGLLYLGALQATTLRGRPGLHALDEKQQRKLVTEIQTELRGEGESLLAPKF